MVYIWIVSFLHRRSYQEFTVHIFLSFLNSYISLINKENFQTFILLDYIISHYFKSFRENRSLNKKQKYWKMIIKNVFIDFSRFELLFLTKASYRYYYYL